MIVSLVNNFKTISFLTSDIASKITDTKSMKNRQYMQFLDTNKLDAAFDH